MPNELDDDEGVLTPDGLVFGHTIQELQNETYWSALQLWSDWKLFGLPHGGGPLDEKESVLLLLRIMETASKRVEAWKMEQHK